MESKTLSGIERELVLQYLIDGNVPVTVTPFEDDGNAEPDDDGKIHPLSSAVFPVAIKAEKISVLKEGIILLMNVPKNVENFLGKKVKVEFYFNSVGLFFTTEMKKASSGPALVIPKEISRIEDVPVEQKYDFSAKLYTSENEDSSVSCVPASGFRFFSRPAWNTIKLENQQEAKKYLESFVKEAKKSGKAGNGIQLVNICRYMVEEKPETVEAVQGRMKPFDILFLNHERFVFGFEKNRSFQIKSGNEYMIKISFALRSSSAITRDIQVHIRADSVYKKSDGKKICADCTFTDLKEEDVRFLYEKATSLLFI